MSRKKLFPGCMLHAAQKNCLAVVRKTTQRHCGHNLSQFCDSFFHVVHEKWAEKLFLNSDIGIVILYIVKYIRKAFSLPKKINFEVQNLTNIHVFRFAFSDLYCYHTDLQNARNAVSDNLIFKISRGGMPPDPPSKERLRRSLVRIINWSHPPVKILATGL